MWAIRESNSFCSTSLDPIKDRLQEIFGCAIARTSAMVMNFFLTMLYSLGYWSFSGWFPSHLSSQKRTCVPLFILKVPKRRKSCFTFIKLDQKYESPGFHSTWTNGWDTRYLFLSNCYHIPSEVNNLNNHLLKRAMFLILRSWIPRPPWSLGWHRIFHLARWYFLLLSSPCQ